MKKIVFIILCLVYLLTLSKPQIIMARAGGAHGGTSSSSGISHGGYGNTNHGPWSRRDYAIFLITVSAGLVYLYYKRKRKYGYILPGNKIKFDVVGASPAEKTFWTSKELVERIKTCHKQIQISWSEMNASNAGNFMSDELIKYQQRLLEQMEKEHRRNIVKNIRIVAMQAHSLDMKHTSFLVKITARMIDYELNESTGKVNVGSRIVPQVSTETWSFKKIDGQWVVDWIYSR